MVRVFKIEKTKNVTEIEYCDLQKTLDDLFKLSKNNNNFYNLTKIMSSRENILIACSNIKKYKKHIVDETNREIINNINKETTIQLIKNMFKHYQPKPVKSIKTLNSGGMQRPFVIPHMLDAVFQQCILQVLEPICEAKFNNHSFGYRPLRNRIHAIAEFNQRINLQQLTYVIDLNINEFFVKTDHSKLINQLWTFGIREKRLLSIIKTMLKSKIINLKDAPLIEGVGVYQTGLLTPLLSNIYLNEFDWWLSSQWETHPLIETASIGKNKNGSDRKSNGYRKLRTTNLKEIWFVRYNDNIKIFSNSKSVIEKVSFASEDFLLKRLRLEVDKDKTNIVNLKNTHVDFLGLKIKAEKRKDKWCARSRISVRDKVKILEKLKKQIKYIQHCSTKNKKKSIHVYNSMVYSIHDYYKYATNIAWDIRKIHYDINKLFINRFGESYAKDGVITNKFIKDTYGKSSQIRYLYDVPIIPIGYIRGTPALGFNNRLTVYKKEDRDYISTKYNMYNEVVKNLLDKIDPTNLEYSNNRISKFVKQNGKCAITGELLNLEGWHCHHIKPKSFGGDDSFKNLIIIKEDIHRLIHSDNEVYINKILNVRMLTDTQLIELNKLRLEMNLFLLKLD